MSRTVADTAWFARLALLAPAAVVFAMGFDNGGYSLSSRNFWAIVVWWAIILVVALGGSQAWSVGAPTLVVGGLLSAFACVTLLSAFWADSAERAVNEFNRAALYVGVFVLVSLFSSRLSRARWCDGFAIGICGVVIVSLISRFAPDAFSDRGAAEVLPGAVVRLSFPLGYWNGLAILAALAVPFLLRSASTPGRTIVRAAAVTPLPAIATVIYLASSRGGYATALLGAIAFLVFSRERWWPSAAIAAGALGSAVSVAGVAQQSAFVNMPTSSAGRDEASAALFSLALGCLAAGLTYGVLIAILRGRPAPGRRIGIAAVSAAAVVAIVAVVATDPLERFRAFKRAPSEAATPTADFVRSHLLSANGSGRWQFWESALDAFRGEPLLGHGAGSYEAWWAERGSLAVFVRDAHSLYVESLAETGVLGVLLLVAAFSVGIVTAVRQLRRMPAAEALDLAAPTAVFVAFTAAAAIDWMWEMTVVSAVAFSCLALMVTPLGRSAYRERIVTVRPGVVLAGLAAAWLVICMQAIPYLSELRIRASEEAAMRGDGADALDAAESARAIQPWAASPWLQVALVREELGELRAAESAIARARENDSADWRLWLVTARLQTKLGDIAAARASLRRARSLNPRSPLFQDG